MAKIKKHAEILDQLHAIVKSSSAQNTVTGAASQLESSKVSDKTETIDKNKVKPEDLKTEIKQDPSSESAGESVSSKSAEFKKLSEDILNLMTKASADAQETVTGKPTELNVTQVSDKTENIDKNTVKPDDLKTEIKQAPSVEDAGKAVSADAAKGETKVEEKKVETAKEEEKKASMASKIAAYNAGANIVRDLLKQSGSSLLSNEKDLLKEAGARDMELLINEATANLKTGSNKSPVGTIDKAEVSKLAKEAAVKEAAEAEIAGAAYFEELYKAANAEVSNDKQAALEAKIAEMEEKMKEEHKKEDKKKEEEMEEKKAEALAIKVANILEARLKSESASK